MSKLCRRCDSPLDTNGYCLDDTCPFSNHKQGCSMGWIGHPAHLVDETEECTCGTIDEIKFGD